MVAPATTPAPLPPLQLSAFNSGPAVSGVTAENTIGFQTGQFFPFGEPSPPDTAKLPLLKAGFSPLLLLLAGGAVFYAWRRGLFK